MCVQAPLFTIKAKLFAKSTFVIGYDTAIRLIMPKYYGGEVNMILELASMRYRGCSFLVAGRLDSDNHFKTMDDVVLPEPLKDLVCYPLPGIPMSQLPTLSTCGRALGQALNKAILVQVQCHLVPETG